MRETTLAVATAAEVRRRETAQLREFHQRRHADRRGIRLASPRRRHHNATEAAARNE
jgi:hypothetical protein